MTGGEHNHLPEGACPVGSSSLSFHVPADWQELIIAISNSQDVHLLFTACAISSGVPQLLSTLAFELARFGRLEPPIVTAVLEVVCFARRETPMLNVAVRLREVYARRRWLL